MIHISGFEVGPIPAESNYSMGSTEFLSQDSVNRPIEAMAGSDLKYPMSSLYTHSVKQANEPNLQSNTTLCSLPPAVLYT